MSMFHVLLLLVVLASAPTARAEDPSCAVAIRALSGAEQQLAESKALAKGARLSQRMLSQTNRTVFERLWSRSHRTARAILQKMNHYTAPVAVVDDSAVALAWSRVATWGPNEARLSDADKALLQAARDVLKEGGDAGTRLSVADEIKDFIPKFKSYKSDQQRYADQLAQYVYEIEVIDSLPKDFRGQSIPHEISGFGTAPDRVEIYADAGMAANRRLLLKKEIRRIQKVAGDRAVAQAILSKRVETFFNILEADFVAAKRKFGASFDLPTEYEDFLRAYRALRTKVTEADGGVREVFKPEFTPPSWVWAKYHRVQFTDEVRNFFRTAAGRLRTQLGAANVRKRLDTINRFLTQLDVLKDPRMDELGLRRLSLDYASLRNWRLMRTSIAFLGLVGGVGGTAVSQEEGEVTADTFTPDFIINVAGLIFDFEGRRLRNLCVTASDGPDFQQRCRDYLAFRFPLEDFRDRRGTLETILEKGLVNSPKAVKEMKKIFEARKAYIEEGFVAQANLDTLSSMVSENDPVSSNFQMRLIMGIPLTDAEIKAGVTPAKKFLDVLLAPKTKGGYLYSRYANALQTKSTFPDENGRIRMITIGEYVAEAAQLHYEREVILEQFFEARSKFLRELAGLGESERLSAQEKAELSGSAMVKLTQRTQSKLELLDRKILMYLNFLRQTVEANAQPTAKPLEHMQPLSYDLDLVLSGRYGVLRAPFEEIESAATLTRVLAEEGSDDEALKKTIAEALEDIRAKREPPEKEPESPETEP